MMKLNGKECPYQYCIECETMTPVFGADQPYHHVMVRHEIGFEEEICDGPFADCPPPEITEEIWDSILAENVS